MDFRGIGKLAGKSAAFGAGGGLALGMIWAGFPGIDPGVAYSSGIAVLSGGGLALQAVAERKGWATARKIGIAMPMASMGMVPLGLEWVSGMAAGAVAGAVAVGSVVGGSSFAGVGIAKALDGARIREVKKGIDEAQAAVEKEKAEAVAGAKLDSDLIISVTLGNEAGVRELLAAGANPNGRDDEGDSPLHWAARRASRGGVDGIVEALLKAGANPSARNWEDGRTPLLEICGSGGGLEHLAERLVKAGADVNARDLSGMTPLGLAIWSGESGMAKTLLRLGADPDGMIGEEGARPLIAALRVGQKDCVLPLIMAGADWKKGGAFGESALKLARKLQKAGNDVGSDLLAMALAEEERGKLEKAGEGFSGMVRKAMSDLRRAWSPGSQGREGPEAAPAGISESLERAPRRRSI